MDIFVYVFLLFGSIYAIVKVSDVFVDIASGLGKRGGLNDYFIGSFLVGIGTSLPELFTSIAAVTSDSPELVVPTVFGTIAANIGGGLGLGVLCLFFFVRTDGRLKFFSWSHPKSDGYLDFNRTRKFPIMVAAASVLLMLGFYHFGNEFGRLDALAFILFYAIFIARQIYKSRHSGNNLSEEENSIRGETDTIVSSSRTKNKDQITAGLHIGGPLLILIGFFIFHDEVGAFSLPKEPVYWAFSVGLALFLGYEIWDYTPQILRKDNARQRTDLTTESLPAQLIVFVLSIAFLYVTGEIIVDSLGNLARVFNIESGILAASALAIGTSLPDIVVALIVLRRGRDQLLVGHIFQSNIFDAFLILGVCGLIQPLGTTVPASISIYAAAALTLPLLWVLRSRKINIWGGFGLFAGFLLFLALLYG